MCELSETITRKFENIIDIEDGWEIETDDGWKPVSKIMKTIQYEIWDLVLEDNIKLSGADDHIIFDEHMKQIFIKNLKKDDIVQTKYGLKKVISCKNTEISENMYDIEVNSENHRFYSNDILSHNTTCAAAYMLWAAVTATKKNKQTILITANKLVQAQEVLERIKYSYQNLPRWMQPGILKFNERTIVFDNGSKIVCRATTADAPRGLSPTIVYLDEMAFVPKRIAESFMAALKPTLSSDSSKLIITSTPMNDEDEFAKIWNGANEKYDDNGNKIENGEGRNGFYPMKFIWSDHPWRDPSINPKWEKEFRSSMTDSQFRQEFECEFISSDETLIDSTYMSDHIKSKPELFKIRESRWFKEPRPNHVYALGLDPSMGTGGDPAAIQVFDLTTMEQIAEWKSSITPTVGQVKMLLEMLYYIHSTMSEDSEQKGDPEIYWSVENNACGEGTLVAIQLMGIDNFPGDMLHDNTKRNGMNTNPRSKITACSIMKRLVEKGKLKFYSAPLIAELKNFVASGTSYSAKIGEHDDLVMATLLIVRIYNMVSKWEDNVSKEDDLLGDVEEIGTEPMPMGFL